ncbi:MAG: hypothetical protein ACLFRI_06755 [Candidatus Izemoplasmataceae bacterium]
MKNNSSKTFSRYPLILNVLFVFINMVLIYWLFIFTVFIELLFIIIIASGFNAYFIVYKIIHTKKVIKPVNYDGLMQTVVNDLPFAKATNEEIYMNKPEDEVLIEDSEEDYEPIEVVEILRPKEIVEVDAVYDKPIQMNHYVDKLTQYMIDSGLSVEKNMTREMFASIAGSRLIILDNDNKEISLRYVELFSDFIGAKHTMDEVNHDSNTLEDLLSIGYQLDDLIQAAHNHKNTLYFYTLNQVDLKRPKAYIDALVELSYNIGLSQKERAKDQESLIPSNLWFFIIPKKYDVTSMSRLLLEQTMTLPVKAQPLKPKSKVTQNPLKLSFEGFTNFLTDACESHYILEEDWKQFDALEIYTKPLVGFFIDNRLFRQLERFSSTFLMLNGDYKAIIDKMLASKILPLVFNHPSNDALINIEEFLLMLDQWFDLEYLNQSKIFLKTVKETMKTS